MGVVNGEEQEQIKFDMAAVTVELAGTEWSAAFVEATNQTDCRLMQKKMVVAKSWIGREKLGCEVKENEALWLTNELKGNIDLGEGAR